MNVSDALSPIPVSVTGWTPTSYGVWSAVIIQLCFIAGLVVKKGPEWLTAWSAARSKEAEDDRLDQAAQHEIDVSVADRLTKMEARLTCLSQALTFAMNAAVISNAALEAVTPDNSAIKQSRELLGMAADVMGSNDPFSKSLNKLANIRGTNE